MRWPIHPTPILGESLLSWLCRISEAYGLSTTDLISIHLGHQEEIKQLNLCPSEESIMQIAQKTGQDFCVVKNMTLSGLFPWVADNQNLIDHDFDLYINQFPVLFTGGIHSFTPSPWSPWIYKDPLKRVCPRCMQENPRITYLGWKLPFLLTCHKHKCLLKPAHTHNDSFFFITDQMKEINLPDYVIEMDQLTWQAVFTGEVNLPYRKINSGVWFRMLRRIIQELSIAPNKYKKNQRDILKKIWDKANLPIRAKIHKWSPFEYFDYSTQCSFLIASAAAINLLSNEKINGSGKYSHLFIKPKHKEVYEGKKEHNSMKKVLREIQRDLELARSDNQVAVDLFLSMLFGKYDDDKIIAFYKKSFRMNKIPEKHMSHIDIAITFCRA